MIKLPRSLLTEIYGHSQRAYPEECCGFLLGRSSDGQRLVIQTQPTSNARMDDRQRRFLINPDEYLRTEAESEAKDLEIIGFYHSHPDHEARPSSYDFENAWPWFSYVIVSVTRGNPKEVTSWVVDDDRRKFTEEPVLIVS